MIARVVTVLGVVLLFVIQADAYRGRGSYHGRGGHYGGFGWGYYGPAPSTPVCVRGNVEDEKDPVWKPFWVDGSRILGVPPGLWKCAVRPSVEVPWWHQTFDGNP